MFLFFPAMTIPGVLAQDDEMLFVMAYGSDIGELNPLTWRSERSHWYDMLVYDSLLSTDDNLNLIPWLAEDWTVSADGLTLTFDIREGVTWHDGEPLTADDVAFTFEYIKAAPSTIGNWWNFMQNLTSATAVGNTVTCVFDKVNSFAAQTLGQIYILPEHTHDGVAADDARWDDEDDLTAHIGSGPFKYVERVPDEYTELERFDDWWGPDNPYVGQLPNIERVRIDVVIGQDARILAMRSGEADTERYEVFGAYVTEILNSPELQLVTGVASQWDYVWGFNLTIPGLDDIRVREAMALALDRTELINIGRLGFGTATLSAIPEVFFPSLHDAAGNFMENVTLANEILDAAGYIDTDADGIRNGNDVEVPAAEELEFDCLSLSWDDISVATVTGLKLQMEDIGIKINNVVTDDGPMYDAIYTGEYEMYSMAHGYDNIPDHIWWRLHSSNIFEWGDNVHNFVNSTADTILDDYMASTPATIEANALAAAEVVLQNVPYVPLYLSDDTHALRAEWVNYTAPAGGPFTAFNPRAMVFMYDNTHGQTTPTPPPGGTDMVLILGIGAGALLVGVVVTYFALRRK
jgi:peptide/nickel transport system substrate-binding protein